MKLPFVAALRVDSERRASSSSQVRTNMLRVDIGISFLNADRIFCIGLQVAAAGSTVDGDATFRLR
jgi:hypothetical protein